MQNYRDFPIDIIPILFPDPGEECMIWLSPLYHFDGAVLNNIHLLIINIGLYIIISTYIMLTIIILANIKKKIVYKWFLTKKIFSLLIPSGCPLALLPLLALIEIISYLSKNVGLRLSTDILSGLKLLNILSLIRLNPPKPHIYAISPLQSKIVIPQFILNLFIKHKEKIICALILISINFSMIYLYSLISGLNFNEIEISVKIFFALFNLLFGICLKSHFIHKGNLSKNILISLFLAAFLALIMKIGSNVLTSNFDLSYIYYYLLPIVSLIDINIESIVNSISKLIKYISESVHSILKLHKYISESVSSKGGLIKSIKSILNLRKSDIIKLFCYLRDKSYSLLDNNHIEKITQNTYESKSNLDEIKVNQNFMMRDPNNVGGASNGGDTNNGEGDPSNAAGNPNVKQAKSSKEWLEEQTREVRLYEEEKLKLKKEETRVRDNQRRRESHQAKRDAKREAEEWERILSGQPKSDAEILKEKYDAYIPKVVSRKVRASLRRQIYNEHHGLYRPISKTSIIKKIKEHKDYKNNK